MKIISDWLNQDLFGLQKTVLTIGVFDGLHLGHQFLIKKVIQRARDLKISSLVLTFDPHPLAVLSPFSAPETLTTFEQKASILEPFGLDLLGRLCFNEDLSKVGALDFLNDIIISKVTPVEMLIGPDFRFGRGAEGHFDLIKNWSKGRKIKLFSVEQQKDSGNQAYASSQVRSHLKVGLVEQANLVLGRPYLISGKVVTGEARGRQLGFPTANLGQIEQLIPGPGVYAVKVRLKERLYPAMTSIGHNPTFSSQYLTVETYIFDFSEDIYGQSIDLKFMAHLRGMVRFDSLKALVDQLKKDEEKARTVLLRLSENLIY